MTNLDARMNGQAAQVAELDSPALYLNRALTCPAPHLPTQHAAGARARASPPVSVQPVSQFIGDGSIRGWRGTGHGASQGASRPGRPETAAYPPTTPFRPPGRRDGPQPG